jgi:hypothetical protein
VDQPNILPVPASHVQKLGFARESGRVRTRATRAVARPVSMRKVRLPAHLSAHFARLNASSAPPDKPPFATYLTFNNFSESTIG